MITGVLVKKLVRHPDERGYFEELIRCTDDFFAEGFGQLSHTFMVAGVVKAWHVHKTQTDWWFCAAGKIKMAVYDLRKDSPTYKELNEFILGDTQDNVIVKIPSGVAHGMKVLEGPCHFVYVTNRTYDPTEEGRVPYNDSDIGYDWVQGMPITNKNIT
ncbi:MAG: dTDP-4-dehydrorhamnose 3,5-epimerase family protein [Candidatus Gottesmanbacteria bacterium]|nr:dTDP-4-dehydrorhamnose 3,5-epimerase family protein [Candidatus Gottesmanbacteria bacterium]